MFRITEYEKEQLIDALDNEIDLLWNSYSSRVSMRKKEQLLRLKKRIVKIETKKWWEFWR